MAAVPIITCPECEKKFKPKADMSGKKMKCPFCEEAFVVPHSKEAKAKAEKSKPDGKPGKGKAGEAKDAPAVVAAAPEPAAGAGEDGDDPYGVKHVDLVPRCPNCTHEMGQHEIICLACGYNTLTRQWGKTTIAIGVSGKRQFMHLLPALGSTAFVLLSVIGLMFFYSFIPVIVAGHEWWEWLDSEAVRMLSTICIFFPLFWMAGVFCFYRFIQKPIPDEIELN
jgi:hypothetical protein